MTKTKQGVRNLDSIRSTQKNPRIIQRQVELPVPVECAHEWGTWTYEGDGMDHLHARTCRLCGDRQGCHGLNGKIFPLY